MHGAQGDRVDTPFWKVEEGTFSGRSVPEAETEEQTRTSARAACCPEALPASLSAVSKKAQ